MFKLIQANRYFFILFFIWILIGALILNFYGNFSVLLWVNQHSYASLDGFFIFMTYIGDGLAYTLLAIILLWFNFRKSIQTWLIFGFCSLFSQVLKNMFFPNAMRPLAYLRQIHFPIDKIRFIPGIPVYLQHSFPSGHSLTGFSLALLMAFWVKQKGWGVPFFFLGFFIAYSRLFLVEHFFQDIYSGSIIGVICTLVLYYYLKKSNWPQAPWADKGIRDLINK